MLETRTVDLNTLIKKSAERLLPLLGDEIQLCLFLASDVVEANVAPVQIEEILAELLLATRQEAETGGLVWLRTENVTIPSTGHSDAPPGSATHVVVTFRQSECLVQNSPIVVTEVRLRGVRRVLKESRGFMTLTRTASGEAQIRIHLPALKPSPAAFRADPFLDRRRRVRGNMVNAQVSESTN